MLAMDQVLKANELNFSVLAIVPAILIFGAALLGVKRLIFRRPSRTQLYRRMRRCLRGVETILITHYGSGKALDDKHTGFLLLLLQKFEDLVRNGLPAREQTDILADVQQLRSVDLDIQQKVHTRHAAHHTTRMPSLTLPPLVLCVASDDRAYVPVIHARQREGRVSGSTSAVMFQRCD